MRASYATVKVLPRKNLDHAKVAEGSEGLLRTAITGAGCSLSDAFAKLVSAPNLDRVSRHPHRKLIGGRVLLTPEEGKGYSGPNSDRR